MRRKLVVGNWKMHGSQAENEALLSGVLAEMSGISAGVAVCVPFPYLYQVGQMLSGSPVSLGAQNVSQYAKGAYTGEVSVGMLKDVACRYVIVGHSERRAIYGESDAVVAEKYSAIQSVGLTPILCVGETLAEREAGITEEVVGRQLDAVIQKCGMASFSGAIVAYEPVWAIGTGKTATPDQAQSVHAFIRSKLARLDAALAEGLILLYGGSVKAANASELFAQQDIDGGLIGGASLDAAEFLSICRSA